MAGSTVACRRKGGPGTLGLRSRYLGAKLLLCVLWHYLSQNNRLQCEPGAHWPRTLPIWEKVTVPSLPKGSGGSLRRGLVHRSLVTFFPFRHSSHPDHNIMASKDMGRLTGMRYTPLSCHEVAVLGLPNYGILF